MYSSRSTRSRRLVLLFGDLHVVKSFKLSQIETAVAILVACTFNSRQVGLSEETAVPVTVLASSTEVQSDVRGPADGARSRSWACLPVLAEVVARIYGVSRDTRSYSSSGYA